jgi:glycosyltransferase involved in cell wall biosynthesis
MTRRTEKVCVCVGTYNQRDYIEICVRSILSQQFDGELRIIVADDGSTDGTADIVRELACSYPDRVTAICREKNVGGYENYRGMTEKADGDYLAIMDGDDYWLPGKLQAQIEFLRAHPDCPVVYTNAAIIDHQNRLAGLFTNPQPPRLDTGYLLRKGNFLNYSSQLCRMSFRHVPLEIPEPYIDYRLHLRFSLNGPVGFVNGCYTVYRSGVPNSMTTNGADNVRRLYWEALRDIATFDVPRSDLLRSRAFFLGNLMYMSLRQRRIRFVLGWAQKVGRETGWLSVFMALFQAVGMILTSLRARTARLLGLQALPIYHER